MMKYLFALSTCLYFFCACNKKNPILEQAKMEAVMWDIIQLEAYSQLITPPDSVKMNPKKHIELEQKIFSLHGISKDQYNKSYDYFSNHTELMRIIMDSITTKADRNRQKMMESRYGKSSSVR